MPRDFSQLTIHAPNFDDIDQLLKVCGTRVVDEIVAMIDREEKPDGTPQKKNSPGYAAAKRKVKGYSTPLKGISKISPYLARRETFLREIINEQVSGGKASKALLIRLNRKRVEIGKKLTKKGYWFMGITTKAELDVRRTVDRYLKNKFRKMGAQNA